MPTGQDGHVKKLSARHTRMGKSFVVELQKHFLISDRRDGILEAFNLDLPEFHPVYIENKRVILIEVRQPNTQELLRFIRFQSNKDGYCVGGLLMANFKATLKYRNLGPTKATDEGQTGQHGDGMKLSALVF